MSEPSRVRVVVLRSMPDYGHVRAEIEAPIGPDSGPSALTIGYEILSNWLDGAREAEELAREIRRHEEDLTFLEARKVEHAVTTEPEEWQRQQDEQLRHLGEELAALVVKRAGVLRRMAVSGVTSVP